MSNIYITDQAKFAEFLSRFLSYIQFMDGKSGPINFCDSSSFLGREENYKTRIAEEARKELNCNKWNESWIGSGKIGECTIKAIKKSGEKKMDVLLI